MVPSHWDFQAQEHAKEDGLRRVEASRTDADLGTLLATCPECRLFGHVLGLKWCQHSRRAKASSLLDRCQAGVFELWVPSGAAACGSEVEDRPQ